LDLATVTAILNVLALNPGSSSLKAALRDPQLQWSDSIERVGDTTGLEAALTRIQAELTARGLEPAVVSHRVVHGGPDHYQPTVIDAALLDDLTSAISLAPLHLPGSIDTIRHAQAAWPKATHVACFDTGFHHDLPEASRRLPVAAELVDVGVRRYGFHGLSVMSVLHARPDLDQAVIAHLGSGCSVTAVAGGHSRHTTMSLTPTAGMVSATRTGDLDPEIVLYLLDRIGYSIDRLRTILDRESGLAGIAGGRHDVRDLLAARADGDGAAALALEIFLNSAAMAIASCATVLDNWTALVFTGGVGENASAIRDEICARLRLAGVEVLTVAADEEFVLDQLARELVRPASPLDPSRAGRTPGV
jgi:acetate kinase